MTHIETYLPSFTDHINSLLDSINNNQKFLIVGHSRPDGDCLGSMLGLGSMLESQEKAVQYCASRSHEPSLSRVEGSQKIQYYMDKDGNSHEFNLDPETQVILFLDHCRSNQRSDIKDIMEQYIVGKKTICIDHHIFQQPFTDLDIIDTSSSSASELVWEILEYWKTKDSSIIITPQIATLLYTGLATDTGGTVALEYEKDPIRSHENALHMLQAGANKEMVIDKLNEVSLPMLQFAKLSFERMQFSRHCLWTWSTAEESKALGLDGDQIKIAFRSMKNVIGVKIAIRFTKNGDKRYASLRTATGYNVQRIAEHFGGGGHILAAGVKFTESNRTEKDLIQLVNEIDDLVEQYND